MRRMCRLRRMRRMRRMVLGWCSDGARMVLGSRFCHHFVSCGGIWLKFFLACQLCSEISMELSFLS